MKLNYIILSAHPPHRAVATAPCLTRMSLALSEKLEASAPSTLNTAPSVWGGTTNKLHEAVVWSPLQREKNTLFSYN